MEAMEGGLSPVSGKRKDVQENLLDDGAGSMKKLKRTLTQEHDLKVNVGNSRQHLARFSMLFEQPTLMYVCTAVGRHGSTCHSRHGDFLLTSGLKWGAIRLQCRTRSTKIPCNDLSRSLACCDHAGKLALWRSRRCMARGFPDSCTDPADLGVLLLHKCQRLRPKVKFGVLQGTAVMAQVIKGLLRTNHPQTSSAPSLYIHLQEIVGTNSAYLDLQSHVCMRCKGNVCMHVVTHVRYIGDEV